MENSESMEKNRERMEYREVDSCTDSSFLSCAKEGTIKYIKTAGRSKQVRVPIEKDWGIQRLMDYFADHPKIVTDYLYKNIESFY